MNILTKNLRKKLTFAEKIEHLYSSFHKKLNNIHFASLRLISKKLNIRSHRSFHLARFTSFYTLRSLSSLRSIQFVHIAHCVRFVRSVTTSYCCYNNSNVLLLWAHWPQLPTAARPAPLALGQWPGATTRRVGRAVILLASEK